MDKKLTAIYCRVASANEYAIEVQRDYLYRYAEEHGFGNIRVYADNGYTGLSFKRLAFLYYRDTPPYIKGGVSQNFSKYFCDPT